jgi:serine phosphatase RsbU (regulator of sigma subunit)
MSMLGVSYLQEIINLNNFNNAADILNQLRERVKATLNFYDDSHVQISDGIDISLVIYDKIKNTIDFSGAYNHMLLFQNKELTVVKADNMPIGNHMMEERPFNNVTFQVNDGDSFYLMTDGYVDQFGGKEDKKYSPKQFRSMLNNIQSEPMKSQLEIIKNSYFDWKNENKQIDDVLILGVRC